MADLVKKKVCQFPVKICFSPERMKYFMSIELIPRKNFTSNGNKVLGLKIFVDIYDVHLIIWINKNPDASPERKPILLIRNK